MNWPSAAFRRDTSSRPHQRRILQPDRWALGCLGSIATAGALLLATSWSSPCWPFSSSSVYASESSAAHDYLGDIGQVGPDEFGSVVEEHFAQARACWKQRRIPSPGLRRNEAEGFTRAQRRFWPGSPEYRGRLLSFMLSEGGGLPDGNPQDPSYGVMHLPYSDGRFSARYWAIEAPDNREAFIARLGNDSRWCIMLAAGELCLKESRAGGDWLRAVAMTKYGARRFEELVNAHPDRAITDFPVVAHYLGVLSWVRCIEARVAARTPADCGCLPPSP